MTNKVLAAVDNSITARPVLSMASALSRVLGAEVEAFQVREDEGFTARANAASMGMALSRVEGDPRRRISERAGRDDVVAVVLGSRNTASGGRTGHLAQELANELDKPVVLVPPDAKTPNRLGTVVIALEGAQGKARGLRRAVEVSAGADLNIVVVHVDDESSVPSFSDQDAHEADAYADEFLARYLPGAPEARLELRIGNPAEQIMDVADRELADLLAIGWPQTAQPDRGLVAREIVGRSHVPVLLVALESE